MAMKIRILLSHEQHRTTTPPPQQSRQPAAMQKPLVLLPSSHMHSVQNSVRFFLVFVVVFHSRQTRALAKRISHFHSSSSGSSRQTDRQTRTRDVLHACAQHEGTRSSARKDIRAFASNREDGATGTEHRRWGAPAAQSRDCVCLCCVAMSLVKRATQSENWGYAFRVALLCRWHEFAFVCLYALRSFRVMCNVPDTTWMWVQAPYR